MFIKLTGRDRAWVNTVDSDSVGVTQLFRPNPDQSLVGCFGWAVYSVSGNTEASSSRRDEDNTTSSRQVRQSQLSQENWSADIAVEMSCVQVE